MKPSCRFTRSEVWGLRAGVRRRQNRQQVSATPTNPWKTRCATLRRQRGDGRAASICCLRCRAVFMIVFQRPGSGFGVVLVLLCLVPVLPSGASRPVRGGQVTGAEWSPAAAAPQRRPREGGPTQRRLRLAHQIAATKQPLAAGSVSYSALPVWMFKLSRNKSFKFIHNFEIKINQWLNFMLTAASEEI